MSQVGKPLEAYLKAGRSNPEGPDQNCLLIRDPQWATLWPEWTQPIRNGGTEKPWRTMCWITTVLLIIKKRNWNAFICINLLRSCVLWAGHGHWVRAAGMSPGDQGEIGPPSISSWRKKGGREAPQSRSPSVTHASVRNPNKLSDSPRWTSAESLLKSLGAFVYCE